MSLDRTRTLHRFVPIASAVRCATFGRETFPATREQFNTFIGAESAKCVAVEKRAKASLD